LSVQRLSHNLIHAAQASTAVHDPIITSDGNRIAGLRLGDRRAHALLQALLVFRLLPDGFLPRLARPARRAARQTLPRDQRRSNQLRPAPVTRPRPDHPHSETHRYRITDTGLHHAMLITHLHTRLLQPGLAQLTDPDPPAPSILRTAARNYQHAPDQLTQQAGFTA
jgi:hypothetical protein